MDLLGKTILIIGGSRGLGLELAKRLSQKGNNIIITGEDEEELKAALYQLVYGSYEIVDVTRAADVRRLYKNIKKKYDGLHLLINDAGKGYVYELMTSDDQFIRASEEMMNNYLCVIRMVDQLLPLLMRVPEAGIVNISSVAGIVPVGKLPTYSASKAALHCYTKLLRPALAAKTRVKVFELMLPETAAGGDFPEIGMGNDFPVNAARVLIGGLETNEYELSVYPVQ